MKNWIIKLKEEINKIIEKENYGKLTLISILSGILLFLLLGKDGYENTIGKINIGVLTIILFIMCWINLFQLIKFKKSVNKVNEIFKKYFVMFLIINFEILLLKGLYFFQIYKFNYRDFIENISCILGAIIWILIIKYWIKLKEKEEKLGDEELLFASRENYKEGLKELILSDDNSSMILIDGEWGIGKTFFVNKAIEELVKKDNKKINKIEIDAMLFNSRKSLKDELFNGLSDILEKNGIIGKSINDISEKMDSIIETENKFINIALKFIKEKISIKNKTFSEDIEEIKRSIKKLDNIKIVVIIENIERILKKDELIEMVGFLHEMQSIEGLTFVVCADKKIMNNLMETDNYIDKFFLNEIYLKKIEAVEIAEKIGERKEYKTEKTKVVKVIGEILEKINSIDSDLEKAEENIKKVVEEKKDEYNQAKKLCNDFLKLINIPRQIEKIYIDIKLIKAIYKNLYEKYIDEDRYLEILIRVCVMKVILEIEYKNKTEEEYRKILSIKKDYFENSLFGIKTDLGFWDNLLKCSNEIEEKAYLRILMEKTELDRTQKYIEEFRIENIEKNQIYEAFENLIEYNKYLDIKDDTIKKYRDLREKIYELSKEEYIKIISIPEIIKLEKRYLFETDEIKESIFSKIEGFKFVYIKNDIELIELGKNFVEAYKKEFEILFTVVFGIEKKTYMEYTNESKGIKLFFKKLLKLVKNEDEIKNELENTEYWEENEIVKMEGIVLKLFDGAKLEGKDYLKKIVEQFFKLSKEILKYPAVNEEKKEKMVLKFEEMSDSEQLKILRRINFDVYDLEELKNQEKFIKYDVKVEFYSMLNEVKKNKEKN